MTICAKFVLIALVCCFSFIIYLAFNKLESWEIGSTFTRRYEKSVKGSRTCFMEIIN